MINRAEAGSRRRLPFLCVSLGAARCPRPAPSAASCSCRRGLALSLSALHGAAATSGAICVVINHFPAAFCHSCWSSQSAPLRARTRTLHVYAGSFPLAAHRSGRAPRVCRPKPHTRAACQLAEHWVGPSCHSKTPRACSPPQSLWRAQGEFRGGLSPRTRQEPPGKI